MEEKFFLGEAEMGWILVLLSLFIGLATLIIPGWA